MIKWIAVLLDCLIIGMVVPNQDVGESIFALTHNVFCADNDLFPNWGALFFPQLGNTKLICSNSVTTAYTLIECVF